MLERYGRNGVLLIRRGVAYHKTEEIDLCWSATVETRVLFIRRGVAYRKTGLHGILFISTVACLHGLLFIHRRPPPASTGSCSSSLHCALLHSLLLNHPSTIYCSSNPPHHGVLFNHPSTGTPPPSTVHPALHHTTGYCSSRGNATAHCSSNPPPPPATLTVHPRGSIDRLQLAAVAKESLDRVQLTAIDRSLGFCNA